MNEKEEWIIQKYKEEEKMMILLFSQWCINHGKDPVEVYKQAYPYQETNPLLQEVLAETLPAKEAEMIPTSMLLDALSAFGNEDLAFTVASIDESDN